ncbi:hypothetical protein K458DRAFT_413729 [Lentithecium fluviatile CBS 122367]|uniref:UBA domain-containing protein n=1 Tax=Lentithecium fluviatile CBS 122367 TaxID=1168545 RepID=A0A6G1JG61_9PLEO|nr:hypothetical protein K458DRAFT_413729 [Lentithecium fluviatile CBS 122367]
MSSRDSVACASPFSPTHSIKSISSLSRTTSRHSSHHPETRSRFARRHSQRGASKHSPPASSSSSFKSPTKSAHSFQTKKSSSTKSGTILRAVPEGTSCAKHGARDMPNQESHLGTGHRSPTANGHYSTQDRTRRRSNSATALSPKAGSSIKSYSSATNLRGSIGTYKEGKVQWDNKAARSPQSQGKWPSSSRNQKPRIQVVIPLRHTDEKPLPTLPVLSNPNTGHIVSAAGDIDIGYNVSPPTASKLSRIRDSMVSPLSSQKGRPTVHFYTAMDIKVSKPTLQGSPDLSEGARHSSDDSREDDLSSTYSEKSSVTSDEADHPRPAPNPIQFHGHSVSDAFSIKNPVSAGIFDSPPRKAKSGDAETGPHVAPPPRRPRVYGRHPVPDDEYVDFKPTCSLHPQRHASGITPSQPHVARNTPSPSLSRRSLSKQPEMGVINQAVNRSVSRQQSALPSPTLSEAASDLERQLTSFTDENPFRWDDIAVRQEPPLTPQGIPRKDSVTYSISRHSPPPLVPRKSSKRQTQSPVDLDGFRLSNVPMEHIVSQLRRSVRRSRNLTISIPKAKRMTTDSFNLSPIPIPTEVTHRVFTLEEHENVLLNILQRMESLDDLFSCAVINRGFYRLYKRRELDLMKAALRRESPPAWEHREICYPGHDDLDEEDLDRPRQEYTPESYIRYYTRDMYIIAAIKSLIKDKCESFLRPEISDAIISEDAIESSRVDDALWRIWTFCKIFGSGKGREEDVIAQMDWLKGGEIVHQQNCSSSALMWDDMNETLASAPECFAKGNEGGLSAEQLFDMMELWNCLGVLLQPIEGRTIQAREYGVYDNTDIRGGDIDGEELMLDEWYYYLLTLGLSTVLDLAGPCRRSDASVFLIAGQHGCLDWKPPVDGSTRRNFLKEAASRVYEDKIMLTYAETSTKEVQRALSKQRIQKHISELRHRHQAGGDLPYIRQSQDRPMSDWEGVFKNLTRPRPGPAANNLVTHIPSLHSSGFTSALAKELSVAVSEMSTAPPASQSPPRRTVAMPLLPSPPPTTVPSTRDRNSVATSQSPPRRTVAMPLLPSPPPSTVPSNRDRSSMASTMPAIDEHPAFRRQEIIPEMPRLEEHPMFAQHARQTSGDSNDSAASHPAFQQHPLQRMVQEHDSSENSADRAIYRIVEMGFTPEQARLALRMTDLGDGLRVDRAVELLLREGVM